MQRSPSSDLTTKFMSDAHGALTNLGYRNKMIALRPGTRGLSIEFDADPDDLYDSLLNRGRSLQIGCAPLLLAPESRRTAAELRRSIISLRAKAEAIASEQGIDTLRLTIGTIAWQDADGKTRTAPLFTLPVTISNDHTIAPRGPVEPNETFLLHAASFGVTLKIDPMKPPSKALTVAEPNEAGGITILGYISRVNLNLYAGKSAAMHRVLDLSLQPDLVNVGALRVLAGAGLEATATRLGTPNLHVINADHSQDEVITAARAGGSFIVQGPPGTGKTQTIVNTTANLLNDGKRVLVSAEKAAALEVIVNRWPKRSGNLPTPVLLKENGPSLPTDAMFVIATPAVAALKIPKGFKFDVVIIDEASQIRLSHAAVVAALAAQVIVIGDSQQMPPSRVIHQANRPSDAADMTGSLLNHVIKCGLPSIMLKQHYRSQHESLILFSNKRFYNGRLDIIPSPVRDGTLGVSFQFVPDAVYDRSGRRDNFVEATALISGAIALARENRSRISGQGSWSPPHSVGIITMNERQRDLILAHLPDALASEGLSEDDLAGRGGYEMPFVKALENVQGDERDVILISATYGRDTKGRFLANLGLLSKPGAAKRVNVLATRSRSKTVVYHSFDIDQLADSDSDGAQAFRDYWRLSRLTSVIRPLTEPNVASNDEVDMAFRAMERWLRHEGVSVHRFPQFIAGFRRLARGQRDVKHYDVCFYFTGLRSPLEETSDMERIKKLGWNLCQIPIDLWRQRMGDLAECIDRPLDQWSASIRDLLHKVYGAISVPFLCDSSFLAFR
jgi:DNA polymerase III delta prime subunit